MEGRKRGCRPCLSVCLCVLERQREEMMNSSMRRGTNAEIRAVTVTGCCQTLGLAVASKHQRQAYPPHPQPCSLHGYSHRAGLDPLRTLNTIKGQGSRISASSLRPLPRAVPITWALTCGRACHNNTGTPAKEGPKKVVQSSQMLKKQENDFKGLKNCCEICRRTSFKS